MTRELAQKKLKEREDDTSSDSNEEVKNEPVSEEVKVEVKVEAVDTECTENVVQVTAATNESAK
jgi:predicted lipoprotein